ncbi:MAG: hypothetical protein Q8903_09480 [Bacteroidota bacterium]|nr:hypothetical protein [Bacteroidota bacterium]
MKIKATVFGLLIVAIVSSVTLALPRFALRTGAKCSDCHINPAGGEMRDVRGFNMSRKMSLVSPHEDFEMTNKLGPNIMFGFDFRGQFLAAKTSKGTKSDFLKMEGSVYGNVDIAEDIRVTSRYDFVWGIWEAFATAYVLPGGGYIKGGSFVPNYGIKIDDHTAYTRGGDLGVITSVGNKKQGLIFDPRYTMSGGEVGYNIAEVFSVTASVGNSRSPQVFIADPSYFISISFLPQISESFHLMLGASGANFKDSQRDANFNAVMQNVYMYGGFAGFSIGDFSLLGEIDFAKNYSGKDSLSTALMLEASYRIVHGVEAVVRFDRFDPVTKISKDEFSRVIIGFEFFPYSFIEVRPQFRVQTEHPTAKNNAFVLQMHFFY